MTSLPVCFPSSVHGCCFLFETGRVKVESKTRPKIEKLENLPEKELDVLIYDQYMCDVTHVFVALTTTG